MIVEDDDRRWWSWRDLLEECGLELELRSSEGRHLPGVDVVVTIVTRADRMDRLRRRAPRCGLILVAPVDALPVALADALVPGPNVTIAAIGRALCSALFAAALRCADDDQRAARMSAAIRCLLSTFARQIGLPPRERQLLPHMLLGHSTKRTILSAMRCSRGTICTLKRRIQRRMVNVGAPPPGAELLLYLLGCPEALVGAAGSRERERRERERREERVTASSARKPRC